MTIKNLQELNRFKKMVSSTLRGQQEIEIFRDIKRAEDLSVDKLLRFGKKFVLMGVMEDSIYARPIVYNYKEGCLYPKADKFAIFKQIDLLQDIVEQQEFINEVPVPCFETGAIVQSFEGMELVNIEVVYGHSSAQGTPHLTLAEVVSQLSQIYDDDGDVYFFYVCDPAEDCGNLTKAGYLAYRVAVYSTSNVTEKMIPEITVDGD